MSANGYVLQLERTLREPAEKLGFNRIQVAVPMNELTVGDVRDLKMKAINALKLLILADGKEPAAYDITPIIPGAAGLNLPTDWGFSISSTGEVELWSTVVPQDVYLVVYGLLVLDTEEVLDYVELYRGSNRLAYIPLFQAYMDNSVPPELLITMPIPYKPNDTLRIVGVAKATGTTRLILLGYMATTAGKVLSSGS